MKIYQKVNFNLFIDLKLKLKNEVVPMGIIYFYLQKKKNYLEPAKWNKLLKNKNTLF